MKIEIQKNMIIVLLLLLQCVMGSSIYSLQIIDQGVTLNFQSQGPITSLILKGNSLIGQVPSDISKLTSLTILDLSDNLFNGSLPEDLRNLTNLEILNISGANNSFTGKFPLLRAGISVIVSNSSSFTEGCIDSSSNLTVFGSGFSLPTCTNTPTSSPTNSPTTSSPTTQTPTTSSPITFSPTTRVPTTNQPTFPITNSPTESVLSSFGEPDNPLTIVVSVGSVFVAIIFAVILCLCWRRNHASSRGVPVQEISSSSKPPPPLPPPTAARPSNDTLNFVPPTPPPPLPIDETPTSTTTARLSRSKRGKTFIPGKGWVEDEAPKEGIVYNPRPPSDEP